MYFEAEAYLKCFVVEDWSELPNVGRTEARIKDLALTLVVPACYSSTCHYAGISIYPEAIRTFGKEHPFPKQVSG